MSESKRFDIRPWGRWDLLEERAGYKVKKITVDPGERLSLQAHHHRSEHWVFVVGRGKVVKGEETLCVARGDYLYINQQEKHRVENTDDGPLVFIEVQQGERLEEDDIVRFQDDYGRIP